MIILRKIINGIVSIIYPNHCIACNELLAVSKKWLCEKCTPEFEINEHRKCKICGRIIYHNGNCRTCNSSKLYFDKGHSVYEYKDAVRSGIMNYKYKGLYSYGKYFGKIMADYIIDCVIDDMKFDYITAVPLHRKRLSGRGYNQSEIMAKIVAKNIGVEYKTLLERLVNTRALNNLGGEERRKELKGAFSLKKGVSVEGKNILIIDDVFTTGTTINECCKVLKKNKATVTDFCTLSCRSED